MSGELPQGWASIRLEELVSARKGKKPGKAKLERSAGFVPYLDIQAIENGAIGSYAEAASSRIGTEDDLLVVWDGARSGWVGLGREGAIGSTIMALQPKAGARAYLYRWLQSQFDHVNTNTRGTGIPHVDPEVFWNLDVPLPPLAEQRRIVAKLEEVLGKVDASRARLAKIPALLKRFRQSVLAAACSGRLTTDWREERTCKEAASAFVALVQQQRKEAYDAACRVARQQGRRKPKEPWNQFAAHVEDQPQGWCITRIGDVVDCLDHLRIPVNREERLRRLGEVPYYGANGQVGTIDTALFDETLVLVVEDETFIGREKPFSYVIHGKSWVNNHAHVLRALGGMPPEFLHIALSYYDFIPLTSGTTGRRKLTQEALMSAPLQLPPLLEQQEIVRRVEALFALADRIEARFRQAQARVEQLTPALLAKAFRGELVPQDPADEPAVVLLERIRRGKGGVSDPALQRNTYPEPAPRELKVAEPRRRTSRG